MGAAYIIGGVSLIWLGILTYFFIKEKSYLRLLFPQDESRDIRAKLREVVESVKEFREENNFLAKKLDELTKVIGKNNEITQDLVKVLEKSRIFK